MLKLWQCDETVLKLLRNWAETMKKLWRNWAETLMKLWRNYAETVVKTYKKLWQCDAGEIEIYPTVL